VENNQYEREANPKVRAVDYTDDKGRNYRVNLPNDAPDQDAPMGIPVGPPDVVDYLGLPEPLATRLHNLLHEKGLWDVATLRKRPGALTGIWQQALRMDVNRLHQAFVESEKVTPARVLDTNGKG
jgi:hypothetical protein